MCPKCLLIAERQRVLAAQVALRRQQMQEQRSPLPPGDVFTAMTRVSTGGNQSPSRSSTPGSTTAEPTEIKKEVSSPISETCPEPISVTNSFTDRHHPGFIGHSHKDFHAECTCSAFRPFAGVLPHHLQGLKRKLPNEVVTEPTHVYNQPPLLGESQEKRRRFSTEYEPAEKPPLLFAGQRRASAIELLIRVFPKIKVSVLQLILHSCGGDLVQAIEEVLTRYKSDATSVFMGAVPNPWTRPVQPELREFHHPALRSDGFKYTRSPESFLGSPKSAFTPISTFAKAHFINTSSGSVPFALEQTKSKENFPISFFFDSRVTPSLARPERTMVSLNKAKDIETNNDSVEVLKTGSETRETVSPPRTEKEK